MSHSVEADVYVWRYTLLVVHARKEEEEDSTYDNYIITDTSIIAKQHFLLNESCKATIHTKIVKL